MQGGLGRAQQHIGRCIHIAASECRCGKGNVMVSGTLLRGLRTPAVKAVRRYRRRRDCVVLRRWPGASRRQRPLRLHPPNARRPSTWIRSGAVGRPATPRVHVARTRSRGARCDRDCSSPLCWPPWPQTRHRRHRASQQSRQCPPLRCLPNQPVLRPHPNQSALRRPRRLHTLPACPSPACPSPPPPRRNPPLPRPNPPVPRQHPPLPHPNPPLRSPSRLEPVASRRAAPSRTVVRRRRAGAGLRATRATAPAGVLELLARLALPRTSAALATEAAARTTVRRGKGRMAQSAAGAIVFLCR